MLNRLERNKENLLCSLLALTQFELCMYATYVIVKVVEQTKLSAKPLE